PAAVRGVMSDLWVENNRHWDELAGQNTLTQLLGTGRPTQREYLACLEGEVVRETLFVRRLQPARDLKQLQFAVAGTCDSVAGPGGRVAVGSGDHGSFGGAPTGGGRRARPPAPRTGLCRGSLAAHQRDITTLLSV